MKVLYVSYPLLTVSEESAGGAEQMLWTLEREIAARGISTTVAASSGSRVAGELFATGAPCNRPDDFERRNHEHQQRVVELVKSRRFDLVHDKSGSFWIRAKEVDVPVLATLHLPRHFYPTVYFENIPERVSFNCVSASQARNFSDLPHLTGVVSNGILLNNFQPDFSPRDSLLWLGRICEEKGTHLALDIAETAGIPITIAGQVYPFSYHQQYFDREIRPRLARGPLALFVPSPSAEQKRSLLRKAKALLITSLVDETSSLVAMEAAASGTPVIALRRGALPEVVKDGVTGFLVERIVEAREAIQKIQHLNPADCALYARENFSSAKMADGYQNLYEAILKKQRARLARVPA